MSSVETMLPVPVIPAVAVRRTSPAGAIEPPEIAPAVTSTSPASPAMPVVVSWPKATFCAAPIVCVPPLVAVPRFTAPAVERTSIRAAAFSVVHSIRPPALRLMVLAVKATPVLAVAAVIVIERLPVADPPWIAPSDVTVMSASVAVTASAPNSTPCPP